MQKLLKLAVFASLLCFSVVAIQATTITNTPPAPPNTVYALLTTPYSILESGYNLEYGTGAAMTGPNAWNNITNITITLALYNARTGSGEANEGTLELYLDGIATGLFLDGFGEGVQAEHTISFNTLDPFSANYAAIVAALNGDGQLIPTIVDTGTIDADDSLSGRFPTSGNVSVSLTGDFDIPEPGTYLLLSGGLLGLGLLRRFKMKRS